MTHSTQRYGLGKPREECRPSREEDPLREAFERWLDALDQRTQTNPEYGYLDAFQLAEQFLAGISPNPDEAAALLAIYAESPHAAEFGDFLSVCYNRSAASDIVYRGCGDIPMKHIGEYLPEGKTLRIPPGIRLEGGIGSFAKGTVLSEGYACLTGMDAPGTTLLLGAADETGQEHSGICVVSGDGGRIGGEATGLFLITGTADYLYGGERDALYIIGEKARCKEIYRRRDGLVLSLAPVRPAKMAPLIADPWDIGTMPELGAYLRSLLAPFAPGTPAEAQLAASRNLDQAEIKGEIHRLLLSSGYADKISRYLGEEWP